MSLRSLPSVDALFQQPEVHELLETYGRPLARDALRSVLEDAREQVRAGKPPPGPGEMAGSARVLLAAWTAPSLKPVINATGVILHTQLGRAPLSRAAGEAVRRVAESYTALEYDVEKGERGSRLVHAEGLLTRLAGAPAAMVVNNNAGAVLLALSALAKGREVMIARSQLVEIGGGFRVPDIMRQSGARLVEVGTSNRTHLADYEQGLTDRTAAILRAHHSNFRIIGFTSEPALAALAEFARQHDLPLLDDLGSGALLDTAEFGLGHEPTVQESLRAGASLVMVSGDKLLGGPQAGLLVGQTELIARLRKHPLARALRADKLCLAALEATLLHYLRDEATREIPVWKMIAAPLAGLEQRALRWRADLGEGEILEARSTVGGGSLPEETLPTRALSLAPPHPQAFLSRLREESPPVIARIEEDRVLFDPRTVLPDQDPDLMRIIGRVLDRGRESPRQRRTS